MFHVDVCSAQTLFYIELRCAELIRKVWRLTTHPARRLIREQEKKSPDDLEVEARKSFWIKQALREASNCDNIIQLSCTMDLQDRCKSIRSYFPPQRRRVGVANSTTRQLSLDRYAHCDDCELRRCHYVETSQQTDNSLADMKCSICIARRSMQHRVIQL